MVLCQGHDVLDLTRTRGGKHMYHCLEVLFSSTGKVNEHEHIHALYIMYTYGVHLCDVILVS